MTVRISIEKDVLSWILAQIQGKKLPHAVENNLSAWESGTKTPTFRQIEQASDATGIPLGYFFLSSPPEEQFQLAEFRTVDSVELTHPSRELIDTIHNMEMVQNWMRDHLISDGAEKLSFVGKYRSEKSVIELAQAVRKILELEKDWFANSGKRNDLFLFLRSRISEAGVVVMSSGIVENNTHRILDINEFRAFALLDDYAPLIFININDSVNGKVFSILHEFVHLCIGRSSLFNMKPDGREAVRSEEVLCNAVAAEIILPLDLFKQSWAAEIAKHTAEETIQIVANQFHCGQVVVARRALDLSYISHSEYSRIANTAASQYQLTKRGQGGGNFYQTTLSRMDRRFLLMLKSSTESGKTTYTDAFRLTNTNRMTFENLMQYLEG